MAVTVDASVGGVSANSYATLAEADAYHESNVNDADGAAWAGLDEDVRNRALVQATRQLDAYVQWYGSPATSAQRLAWPRVGLINPNNRTVISSGSIPELLKFATAEQARLLVTTDRSLEQSDGSSGLKEIKAGPVDLIYNVEASGQGSAAAAAASVLQTIAPSAWQFVAQWGAMAQAGQGGAVALSRV